MSKENIIKFYGELKENHLLQQKLKNIENMNIESFIKTANDEGCDFTAAEWSEYIKRANIASSEVLTDEELDKVSAGLQLIDLCQKTYVNYICHFPADCPQIGEREGRQDKKWIVGKVYDKYCKLGYW